MSTVTRTVDRSNGSFAHEGVIGGAHFRPAEDVSLMRISPSGMSRKRSSHELPQEISGFREGSPERSSRFGQVNRGSVAYRGPFGQLGEDPDADHAAVMTAHSSQD